MATDPAPAEPGTPGQVRISALARFPIKACAPEPLAAAELGEAGLAHDRHLAIVEGDRVLTQRELPALARVQPRLDAASLELTLSLIDGVPAGDGDGVLAPVTGSIHTGSVHPGATHPVGSPEDVLLFGRPVSVVEQDRRLSEWLSTALGRRVRLVAAPATTRRTAPGETEGLTVLSDEGTVSVHSEASVQALGDRIAAAGRDPVPASRFRANIVLAGCPAHAEDTARTMTVGPVVLRYQQQDARCAVTMVDQGTGTKAGPEPIRTLATYRRTPGGEVVFGVFLAVSVPGTIRVGDAVTLA